MSELPEPELLDLNVMYPNQMLLDYLNRKKKIVDYFSGKYLDLHEVPFTGDRSILKEILLKYNKNIDASEAVISNIEVVENEEIKFVVTGQQPGFLTGPLYTIYKTLSAINYAEKFSNKDVKLIPLFWNASEDHDVQEVNHIKVLDKNNEIKSFAFDDPNMLGKSLESICVCKKAHEKLIDDICEIIARTDFTDELYDGIIKTELSKTKAWGELFSRILTRLMGKWGLVIVEPYIFRPHLSDYFSKIISDPTKYNRAFLHSTSQLTKSGYNPKMHKKEDVVGLFYIDNEYYRHTITLTNKNEYSINNGEVFTKEALLDKLQSEPSRFSTNAIFRPLAQDQMIPTHIFVGGPSEISYHLQLQNLYKEFGLKQPNLFFRMGATIIERHINRIIDKYQFNLTELKNVNQLTNNLLLDENKDFLAPYFDRVTNALNDLNGELGNVNQELGQRVEGRKKTIMKELTNIERMYLRYVKEDNKVLTNQLQKVGAYLFPDDIPQERVFNIFQYLNKYSINILNCMKDMLKKTDPGNHVVLKCWMF
ncbi:MAG: bacillithiol biosynthesis cysteine-adding enzyme BshC [Asgard group archaeon]|nr:bacillithiol biosynthesis cysteine-adding enzyme BshC [Asgard group archaeon]